MSKDGGSVRGPRQQRMRSARVRDQPIREGSVGVDAGGNGVPVAGQRCMNTLGYYLAKIPTPTQSAYGVSKAGSQLQPEAAKFNSNYTYYRLSQRGRATFVLSGTPCPQSNNPARGQVISGSLDVQIRETLINVMRVYGYVREPDGRKGYVAPSSAAVSLNIPGYADQRRSGYAFVPAGA